MFVDSGKHELHRQPLRYTGYKNHKQKTMSTSYMNTNTFSPSNLSSPSHSHRLHSSTAFFISASQSYPFCSATSNSSLRSRNRLSASNLLNAKSLNPGKSSLTTASRNRARIRPEYNWQLASRQRFGPSPGKYRMEVENDRASG